jgi:hypothetical protein
MLLKRVGRKIGIFEDREDGSYIWEDDWMRDGKRRR